MHSLDYIDTSCHSQRDRCRSLSTTNCTSLSEALVEAYDINYGSTLSQVTPYPFFSVFDLFFSGLITDSNAPQANSMYNELNSSSVLTTSQKRCEYLLQNIRLSQKDTEECKWSYSCKYNPHYFPSFTVEAHRDETSQERNCQGITLPNIKFVKTRWRQTKGRSTGASVTQALPLGTDIKYWTDIIKQIKIISKINCNFVCQNTLIILSCVRSGDNHLIKLRLNITYNCCSSVNEYCQ